MDRYDISCGTEMKTQEDGNYVLFTDYKKLQNDMRTLSDILNCMLDIERQEVNILEKKNKKLQEEYAKVLNFNTEWRKMPSFISDYSQYPEENLPVYACLEHCKSKEKKYALVYSVREHDCNWRTFYDDCELSHEYNVIAWMPLIEFSN